MALCKMRAIHGKVRSLGELGKAVHRMFSDMDAGFPIRDGFSFRFEFFRNDQLVRESLWRFDAIFTLNQGLCL